MKLATFFSLHQAVPGATLRSLLAPRRAPMPGENRRSEQCSSKIAAVLLATAAVAAQADGVVFNTPVTYSEPVTYAAGVTYLAPVTYTQTAAVEHLTPVVLERVIVTPTRTYAESEWHMHIASKKPTAHLYPVRSERRIETRSGNNAFRILLPLQ